MLLNQIYQGDCHELLKQIPDGSVNMVLCDPPYGTTALEWDSVLDMSAIWPELRRIMTPIGALVFTASQPYTTDLIGSNREWFKYCLVWEKSIPSGFAHAKNKPLKAHEDVVVFSPGTTIHEGQSERRMTYNPQGVRAIAPRLENGRRKAHRTGMPNRPSHRQYTVEFENYPRSVIRFDSPSGTEHPTQKPVSLFGYLILTYTNPGDTVLDFTAGSGTTGVACKQHGRNYILIEREEKYCKIAERRISEVQPTLFQQAA